MSSDHPSDPRSPERPANTRATNASTGAAHSSGASGPTKAGRPRQLSKSEASGPKRSSITVAVRKRPLFTDEAHDVIPLEKEHSEHLTVIVPRQRVDLTPYVERHNFRFDAVFNETISNETLYNTLAAPLLDHVFTGGNASIFAYGQTGSGKTYTMMGAPSSDPAQHVTGLYMLAMEDMFRRLPTGTSMIVSFYEIYGGKVFDLLEDRKRLCIREDGSRTINVVGLSEWFVPDMDAMVHLVEDGHQLRAAGVTGANDQSSRSHAILSITIRRSEARGVASASIGSLKLIDLAGSERGADTLESDRQTRLEGAEINKSLLALKECIRSLDQNKQHIPFRGSKLTEVLRDSFIGNGVAVMIANVSPTAANCEHTLNTLRYADRVKELKSDDREVGGDAAGRACYPPLPSAETGAQKDLGAASGGPRIQRRGPAANSGAAARGATGAAARTRSPVSRVGRNRSPTPPPADRRGGDGRADGPPPPARRPRPRRTVTLSDDTVITEASAAAAHGRIVNDILAAEDALAEAHRAYIDKQMQLVRTHMEILAAVEQAGSSVPDYLNALLTTLDQSRKDIVTLQEGAKSLGCLLHVRADSTISVLLFTMD